MALAPAALVSAARGGPLGFCAGQAPLGFCAGQAPLGFCAAGQAFVNGRSMTPPSLRLRGTLADVQGLAAGSLCGDRTRSPAAGPDGRRRTRTAQQRAVRCADRARADAAPSSGLVDGHVLSRAKDALELYGDREG